MGISFAPERTMRTHAEPRVEKRARRAQARFRRRKDKKDKIPLRFLLHPPVGWKRFLVDLYHEIDNDQLFNGAAAVAYYAIFAIFPAAIFLLSLLPYLHIENLDLAIMDLLHQAMPRPAAELFTTTVEHVVSDRHGGLLSFGLLASLWAASTGVQAVMQQLNATYGVRETRPYWKTKGLALLLVLLFGAFIVAAFGLIVFGGVVQDKLASVFGWNPVLLGFFAVFRWMVILGLMLTAIATIYYFGPNVDQSFRLITPGSVVCVAVLVAAALGFSAYVSHFRKYEATYGSIGAAIVLLLWLYIVGVVVLIGSEINALLESYLTRA